MSVPRWEARLTPPRITREPMTLSTIENARHRVLVVGVGSIGERHVRCFLKTGRAAVSICEVNAALREAIGSRNEIVGSFANLDAALDESHDAAVVAVPADQHVRVARQLASAGIDLLIEKPLSTSIDGIDELARQIEQQDRVAAVGYVYRAHPALAAMRQAIVSGTFGKALQLVAVAGQHFPTYRPAYRDTYYRDRGTGGGAIQDALTHVINVGEWILGPINRLVADAEHQRLEGVAVEDVVHVLARHGPVLASYSLNQFQAPNELSITIVCERGAARFELHRQRWRWMLEPDTPWLGDPSIPIERDTLFINQANAFLDSIERRAVPLCSLEEGAQTLRVNLAALKSVDAFAWQRIRES